VFVNMCVDELAHALKNSGNPWVFTVKALLGTVKEATKQAGISLKVFQSILFMVFKQNVFCTSQSLLFMYIIEFTYIFEIRCNFCLFDDFDDVMLYQCSRDISPCYIKVQETRRNIITMF